MHACMQKKPKYKKQKKIKLHRYFIKFGTKRAEMQYKVYKNKLSIIYRHAKREYYDKILKENISNIKCTWKILYNLIGNSSASTGLPTHFINDNNKVIKKT